MEDILRLVQRDEGPNLEFKASPILNDNYKIARLMAAFANLKGGIILIGINDDKSIEGMIAQKRHEEKIMNIASDKIEPRIIPEFMVIKIPEKGDVYYIKIPERHGSYHAIKVKRGVSFPIRVGSTIRDLKPYELGIDKMGVEIPPSKEFGNFWSWLGKKTLLKLYGALNVNINNFLLGLNLGGIALILISLLFIFTIKDGTIYPIMVNYPMWANIILIFAIGVGVFSLNWASYIPKTQCPICNSYFSYLPTKKWVYEKRRINDDYEEWKTRTLITCDECEHEILSNFKLEKISIEEEYRNN